MAETNTLEMLPSADLIDRLTGASLDELRALLGRVEDSGRIIRAVIRERQALARRDAAWKTREMVSAGA